MKCTILHETPGRLRVHLCCGRMTLRQADVLEHYLLAVDGVRSVKVYDRTRDAVVLYDAKRERMIRALARFSFDEAEKLDLVPEHTSRALNREFEDKLAGAVLDAAVTVSMARGDFSTAGSVMFMLRLGEILDEWTHKKSVADLAGAMSLNVEQVWLKTGETETLVPIHTVKAGDEIVVRTGSLIPLDGRVAAGEAVVNQSSLTGEPLPVSKREGSLVYAGTGAEEGECVIRVEKASGSGRYDRIVRMIEESEKLKSAAEDKASRLAACLEEHYPHSMANAVVEEAKRRGLTHEEYHSQVQYVVAHGISSIVEGRKVVIGNARGKCALSAFSHGGFMRRGGAEKHGLTEVMPALCDVDFAAKRRKRHAV